MIPLDELRRDVPEFPDAVRTPCEDYGEDDFYAYVQGYDPNTDILVVRLELPEGTVTDEGVTLETAEVIVTVPRETAESASLRTDPGPVMDPRPALRDAALARAEEQERAEREVRIKKIEEEMRTGKRKRLFPELGRR